MNDWSSQYRRWSGESVGVWRRRLSIARYGLRLSLSGKIVKAFLFIGIGQTIALTALFVLFGQLVTPDSALIDWIAATGGEKPVTIINGITSWALLYPEICVDGIYRIGYFFLKYSAIPLSLVTIALFVHRLIAADLASQAIVIYNSKALTRWDYIIGKFAIVSTILSIIWLLPVVVSWFFGNALAPDWAFFIHSFPSLIRALIVGVVAVITLSAVALGVSSMARKTGAAVAYWILGWVTLDIVSEIASLTHPNFQFLNPLTAIFEFGSGVFKMDSFIEEAQVTLPFLDRVVSQLSDKGLDEIPATDGAFLLPLIFLGIISIAALIVVHRKVKAS